MNESPLNIDYYISITIFYTVQVEKSTHIAKKQEKNNVETVKNAQKLYVV